MRQNRREFIQTTASATTALLAPSLELLALTNKPENKVNNQFELRIMATNWGFPGSLEEYCTKAKQDGYDGIEIWWPLEKKSQDELFGCLQKQRRHHKRHRAKQLTARKRFAKATRGKTGKVGKTAAARKRLPKKSKGK